jgi:hypothetical protein
VRRLRRLHKSRAQFAELIAKAMPAEAYTAINDMPDGAVPDVLLSDSFGQAGVYVV